MGEVTAARRAAVRVVPSTGRGYREGMPGVERASAEDYGANLTARLTPAAIPLAVDLFCPAAAMTGKITIIVVLMGR